MEDDVPIVVGRVLAGDGSAHLALARIVVGRDKVDEWWLLQPTDTQAELQFRENKDKTRLF